MRNVCLVGGTDSGKSFLFRGFREVFNTYERPDTGSYQLEDLLGKELVLLNDFEYDTKAKEWMGWWYFKNFLEGGTLTVARPKNRGGNETFKGTAPVLMTAPQEVTLTRGGFEVRNETTQMRRRILYFHLTYSVPEEARQEVLGHCGHCTAKLFLEGRTVLDGVSVPSPLAVLSPVTQPSQSSGQPLLLSQCTQLDGPAPKRPRTVAECVNELKSLKELLDAGALTQEEFTDLKGKLLRGE